MCRSPAIPTATSPTSVRPTTSTCSMSSTVWATRVTSGSSTSPRPRRRPASAGRRNTASRPDPMTDNNTPAIAFIGLGSMGLGMAKNLLKHSHKVAGVDPSRAAQSIRAATAAKVFRLGEAAGVGSLVKTVNQLLAGVHIATAAEAVALAAKAGADTRAVYEVISASAGNSWMFGNRVPHMLDDDYSPLSAVEIFVKDLGLVLNPGHEHRLPLPMAAAAHQLFLAAAGAGWGRLDDAAVVKVYEQAGDFKVSSPRKKTAPMPRERFTKILPTLRPPSPPPHPSLALSTPPPDA